MRAYVLEQGELRTVDSADGVRAAFASGAQLWLDLEERTPDTEALLSDTFKLHPLVIEDIWSERALPKIEDFDEYLYILVHGVKQSATGTIQLVELDLVLGSHYVVTHQHDSRSVAACRAELERSPRLLRKGAPWVAHALLDHLVDHYLALADEVDEELVALEHQVPETAGLPEGREVLRKLFALRRKVHGLRRTTVHQRDILLRLSRGEFDEIPPEAVPFFRDVYDHFSAFTAVVDSYRDMLASAVEAYLSIQSNRMNEVMKALTLISTIMLPLTFIAGVYGMNFEYMPELHWRHGYAYALSLMAAVAVSIVFFFRRKRWL